MKDRPDNTQANGPEPAIDEQIEAMEIRCRQLANRLEVSESQKNEHVERCFDLINKVETQNLELERLKQGLQALVEERTAELVSANRALLSEIEVRKRTEDDLRESRRNLQTLFDTVDDLLFVVDTQGVILQVNASMCNRLGRAESKFNGKSAAEALGPDAGAELEQCLKAGTGVRQCLIRLRTSAGELMDAETIITPGEWGGKPALFCVARDITERKLIEEERLEMERRLLHTQKLESLGVLAGGIAHDFNNLLMAILGNIDMALMDMSSVSPARPAMEAALGAAKRASDLTRQMLAYSGKGRFAAQALDLGELVRENAHILKAAIAGNVALDVRVAPETPSIFADPGQIQQVVMNLITNASEALGERHGTVTISTGVSRFKAEELKASRIEIKPEPGRFVWIEVADTGCGMDENTRNKLFEPFYTTKFMGRGLGMSAVLGIVRGHKGAILVDSEANRGTTIKVLFPVYEDKTPGPEAESVLETRPAAAAAKPRNHDAIMLVDDDEMVRNLTSSMLARLGYKPVVASNGEEAAALFREHGHEIVCVLLDLTMPQKDGVETFVDLRGIHPHVKVILCSGYSEQEATKRFSDHKLAGFLQKPFQLNTLRSELERVLGRN